MTATVGIDTGGTFTDLVAVQTDGSLRLAKHASTPDAPIAAFAGVLKKSGVPFSEIERIVHGTTVATNTVIQRSGATVLFITTEGFEDIPFIQRINRRSGYDLKWLKPKPLVKRRNCLGIAERVDARGNVLKPITGDSLKELEERVRIRCEAGGIEAIAVCLLFSYINPSHELKVEKHLQRVFPDLPVSLSCSIAPVWREYERSSTTLADAYVKPLMQNYCKNIDEELTRHGISNPCSLLKSDGGTTTLEFASMRPVHILFSGLAGGIIGGKYFAKSAGFQDAITLDIGGTSCDVGLVSGGEQTCTTEFELEWGIPVAVPVIEVRTLGAGGGSIAWVDKGGLLNVGPRSAGAKPGPACYGTGGEQPTITDANLVLGRLNPDFFLGGEVPLYPELARKAIQPLAEQLGLTLQAAAIAIVDIADENMTNAIRLLTIERGIDPRDFTLVAFGGAGPLHGVSIARKLGIQTVLVPPHPGLCSAFGAAISELRIEKVQTIAARGGEVDEAELSQRFETMLTQSRDEIRKEGLRGNPRETMVLSMRYIQQNYEQDVVYDRREGLKGAMNRFHQKHHEFYGYHFEDEPIELVNLKVSVMELPHAPRITRMIKDGHPKNPGRRKVAESAEMMVEAVVYRRDSLSVETRMEGPALIEELDSTTYAPSGVSFYTDEEHNMILEPA